MQPPLWAPWRISYILAPKPKGEGCVFCAYASHAPESYADDLVLFSGEHAFVCLNRYPYAGGHLLVIPRRHQGELWALEGPEHAEFFALVSASAERLKRAMKPDGINVGMNLGSAAGAGIAEHLHAHLVPRWSGDNNFMAVVGEMRVINQAIEETFAQLAPFFADLPGSHPAL